MTKSVDRDARGFQVNEDLPGPSCPNGMGPSSKETSITSTTGGNAVLRTRIILLGDHGVGKSAFLANIIKAGNVDQQTTRKVRHPFLASGCTKRLTFGDRNVEVIIQDTAGQERYRSLTSSYYRNAHGCLLFFNAHNQSSFDSLSSWLDDINRYCSGETHGIVLVGITNRLYNTSNDFSPFWNSSSIKNTSDHVTCCIVNNNNNNGARNLSQDGIRQAKTSIYQEGHCYHKKPSNEEGHNMSNSQLSSGIFSDSGTSHTNNNDETGDSYLYCHNSCNIKSSNSSSHNNDDPSTSYCNSLLLPKNNNDCTTKQNYNSINQTIDSYYSYKQNHSRTCGYLNTDSRSGINDDSYDVENGRDTVNDQRVVSEEQARSFAYTHDIPYREVDLQSDFSSIENILSRIVDATLCKNRRCSLLSSEKEMSSVLFLSPQCKDQPRSCKRCCSCIH